MEYEPRTHTAQVMLGIAHHLVDGLPPIPGRSSLILRSDEIYEQGEFGTYFDYAPPDDSTTPQEKLTITPYMEQNGILAVQYLRVQLRWWHVGRSALEVRDFLGDVRALFPEYTELEIGGHLFDRVRQESSTTWGEETRPGVLNSTQNISLRGNRYEP
ncbi:hypothetical protein PQI23_13340 [Leucobacter sp. USCH14]|uniref:hypothetical protein n=1 Tax=Leucobacter sp. USCH14 TaxID=3024838 RepID=UPI0030B786B9